MSLHFTPEEQALYEKELNEVYFGTGLGFLNAHNGFRRGSSHLVIGTTGGGKTTMIRTMIRDFLFNKQNRNFTLGLGLSEETIRDYKQQLSLSLPSHDVLLNTQCMSEIDNPNMTRKMFFEWLYYYQPDLFLFDNITTSKFYMDLRPGEQAKFAIDLKTATKKINCATVIIAHTDAEITDSSDRLINVNDIRGSKSICNLVEFAYVLQRFQIKETFFPTIRTVKYRSQDLVHGLYFLEYEKKIRAFVKDKALDFDKFKEIFGERNKLK